MNKNYINTPKESPKDSVPSTKDSPSKTPPQRDFPNNTIEKGEKPINGERLKKG